MRIQKKCKTCEKEFEAIKDGQFFCSRKCFKKDYYQRNREKLKQLEKRRPVYTCSVCSHACEMPYDPVKNYSKFNAFNCPFCGMPRAVVVEYAYDQRMVIGNSFTAQFVILSAIVSSRTI